MVPEMTAMGTSIIGKFPLHRSTHDRQTLAQLSVGYLATPRGDRFAAVVNRFTPPCLM